MNDCELLREYVECQSEGAFTELVTRHFNLVYATALRVVREAQMAEDVAQLVFIELARKAKVIRDGNALPGWLYRVTCGLAKDAMRTEGRRRRRETEAVNGAEIHAEAEPALEAITPLLDEGMRRLSRVEQDALVWRYFEGKSLRQTGQALSMTEAAVQKRISRAVEKLRVYFNRRGITISGTAVVVVLAAHSAEAAPTGLAGSLAGASLAGISAAAGKGGLIAFWKGLIMTKTQMAVVTAVVMAGMAVPIALQHRENALLRKELAAAQADNARPATLQQQSAVAENSPKRTEAAEVKAETAVAKAAPADIESRTRQAIKGRLWRSPREWVGYLATLAPADVPAALACAERETPGPFRDLVRNELLKQWAGSDPRAAMEYAQAVFGTAAHNAAVAAVLDGWAGSDPVSAAAWAQQLPAGSLRQQALDAVVPQLAWKDPQAAFALRQNLGSEAVWLPVIFHAWAENDAAAAAAKIAELPAGPDRTGALKTVAETWSMADRQATLDWINRLPEAADKNAALMGLLTKWADAEPQQAAQYVAGLPAGDLQGKAVGEVVSHWSRTDPAAAATWVTTLPDGAIRQSELPTVVRQWVQTDPRGVSQWLQGLPADAARDGAIQNYVNYLWDRVPAMASTWADQITEEKARNSAIEKVAQQWLKTDRGAAETWLAQTSLPDERKQQLLKKP